MGDAADALFDSAMREQEDHHALIRDCPRREPKPCDFDINDDGLFECRVCGRVTDL